jgi:hypothetical protein
VGEAGAGGSYSSLKRVMEFWPSDVYGRVYRQQRQHLALSKSSSTERTVIIRVLHTRSTCRIVSLNLDLGKRVCAQT